MFLSSGIDPGAGNASWTSGFLPTSYQGILLRTPGEPILFVATRRCWLDVLRTRNSEHLAATGEREIATRIAADERPTACRRAY